MMIDGQDGLGTSTSSLGKSWSRCRTCGYSGGAHSLACTVLGGKTVMASVNEDTFASNMWAVFDTAGELLLKKHADYGPTNISRSPGGPLNGLRVRMWDKVARINHLIDNGATPENESLLDSFLDLVNYSAIAVMVLKGEWPE